MIFYIKKMIIAMASYILVVDVDVVVFVVVVVVDVVPAANI